MIIKKSFIKGMTTFLGFSVIIVALSSHFIHQQETIKFVFLGLGILDLGILRLFGIKFNQIYPDFIFGTIDNGVLVFATMFGANFAGVAGAVLGGVTGNTITDGLGGLFEGNIAEHQREYKIDNLRTALSTSMGKMAGCLIGAGLSLTIFQAIF